MGASSFNEMELDAIGEIMNISLGASATAVSTMLGTTVNITTPVVNVLTSDEFEFKNLEPAVGVEIAYVEGLEGSNIMMFRRNDVRIIVGMLMGGEIPEESFELDEINISAICEVMNQMMGSSATALSEFLGHPVNISTPVSFEIKDDAEFKTKYFPTNTDMVVVRFVLEIEGKLESEFLNIMSVELTKRLLAPFQAAFGMEMQQNEEAKSQQESAPEPPPVQPEPVQSIQPEPVQPEPQVMQQPVQPEAAPPVMPQTPPAVPQTPPVMPQPEAAPQVQPAAGQYAQPMQMVPPPATYQSAPDPMMVQLLTQMQQSQMQMVEMMNELKSRERQPRDNMVINPASTPRLNIEESRGEEEYANQEMLMKVPLEISVEIGRTKKLVKDILEFTQGSLVVLDKMAGEQADLFVNGECIARGDIVVVEDNFGIRITEIVARTLNPESL